MTLVRLNYIMEELHSAINMFSLTFQMQNFLETLKEKQFLEHFNKNLILLREREREQGRRRKREKDLSSSQRMPRSISAINLDKTMRSKGSVPHIMKSMQLFSILCKSNAKVVICKNPPLIPS